MSESENGSPVKQPLSSLNNINPTPPILPFYHFPSPTRTQNIRGSLTSPLIKLKEHQDKLKLSNKLRRKKENTGDQYNIEKEISTISKDNFSTLQYPIHRTKVEKKLALLSPHKRSNSTQLITPKKKNNQIIHVMNHGVQTDIGGVNETVQMMMLNIQKQVYDRKV